MKTAIGLCSFTLRLLRYLVAFGWDVVLPFIGMRPPVDRNRAVLIGMGVLGVWAYWFALALTR